MRWRPRWSPNCDTKRVPKLSVSGKVGRMYPHPAPIRLGDRQVSEAPMRRPALAFLTAALCMTPVAALGENWSLSTIDSEPTTGASVSLVMDANLHPHVA